jgi:hypothetical protein
MAATHSVTSNARGAYSVLALLTSPYNLSIDANGHRTVRVNGVVIEVNQRARLDFALTIDSKSDIIAVLGSAPLLNASHASVGTLTGNRFVENMPLNGWSFNG